MVAVDGRPGRFRCEGTKGATPADACPSRGSELLKRDIHGRLTKLVGGGSISRRS